MADQPLSRGEHTRRAILETAEYLFLSTGYNGTSMRQIANEAGIAVGGIYNHYGGKEAIFRALLADRSPYPAVIAAMDALDGEDGPALLGAAYRTLQEILLANLNFIGLVLIDAREFESRVMGEIMAAVLPAALDFAERVRAAGGLRADLDVLTLIRSLGVQLIGWLATQMIAFRPGEDGLIPSSDTDWPTVLLDLYLHGIASDNLPEA